MLEENIFATKFPSEILLLVTVTCDIFVGLNITVE